jgi:hypothetical protein
MTDIIDRLYESSKNYTWGKCDKCPFGYTPQECKELTWSSKNLPCQPPEEEPVKYALDGETLFGSNNSVDNKGAKKPHCRLVLDKNNEYIRKLKTQ